ncbi:MAG: cyanophycin synthetase [Pirellulales bacterium]
MASAELPPLDASPPFMHFRRLMFLRGPNIWSRRQCMEVWVDIGPFEQLPSDKIPGFNERYKAWLPTVIEHRCSVGERGGFFSRMDDGTYLGHILEHTVLELQTLAGSEAGFGRAREMSETGVYKVAIRYEEESVGEACLYAARELLKACAYDLPFDVESEIKRLRDLADRRCLGPSTKAIIHAAGERGIPFRRLNAGSLVNLGQGRFQRRIWTAESDRTSAIAESIAQDKQLTKRLLHTVGVPTPEGRRVTDPEDAVKAAADIGSAVVVKPVDGNHGRGVIPQLTRPEDIRQAYDVAAREGSGVLVERFVPGNEHRLLVVGDRLVAASRGEPITVEADGVKTVEQLIHTVVNADPRRGEEENCPLSPVEIDDALRLVLAQQQLSLDAVPAAGRRVLVKRYDNLSADVTREVHPEVARQAVQAAQIVGLDIAGIDVVAIDISCPLEDQRGAVVEVNAGPGLIMHLKPSSGEPQPVGRAIVEHIFGAEGNARVPMISVTGSKAVKETVSLCQRLLARADHKVGWFDEGGLRLNDLLLDAGKQSNTEQTRRLIMHPSVSAIVGPVDAASILREGLGFDLCDAAIVTGVDVEANLNGEFDLFNPEKVYAVFRSPVDVVSPHGVAILNADDSTVVPMAALSRGSVILYSHKRDADAIIEHVSAGKRAVVATASGIDLLEGAESRTLLLRDQLAPTLREQIDAVLPAVAMAWHLGLSMDDVAGALRIPPEQMTERQIRARSSTAL